MCSSLVANIGLNTFIFILMISIISVLCCLRPLAALGFIINKVLASHEMVEIFFFKTFRQGHTYVGQGNGSSLDQVRTRYLFVPLFEPMLTCCQWEWVDIFKKFYLIKKIYLQMLSSKWWIFCLRIYAFINDDKINFLDAYIHIRPRRAGAVLFKTGGLPAFILFMYGGYLTNFLHFPHRSQL